MYKAITVAIALTLAVAAGSIVYADAEVEILVSPQNILLDAVQGGMVTVHADISYGLVEKGSVTLNGVPAKFTFADDCGDLVAKFAEVDIKALVSPPSATLTLAGVTTAGEAFSGSDVVKVRVWRSGR